MSVPPSKEPRAFCTACLKAARACLCAQLQPFDPGAHFVLLMHRKERRDRSGTGTGRMTHQSLVGSSLFVGLRFEEEPEFAALLASETHAPFVLFPGDDACDVSTSEGAARLSEQTTGQGKRLRVFVLDGSWTGARKILEHTPALAALPRVSFSTARRSGFTFKTQPRPAFLSTLEAVHELLVHLDAAHIAQPSPPGAHHKLMELFRSFVSFQDAFSPVRSDTRNPPC